MSLVGEILEEYLAAAAAAMHSQLHFELSREHPLGTTKHGAREVESRADAQRELHVYFAFDVPKRRGGPCFTSCYLLNQLARSPLLYHGEVGHRARICCAGQVGQLGLVRLETRLSMHTLDVRR